MSKIKTLLPNLIYILRRSYLKIGLLVFALGILLGVIMVSVTFIYSSASFENQNNTGGLTINQEHIKELSTRIREAKEAEQNSLPIHIQNPFD